MPPRRSSRRTQAAAEEEAPAPTATRTTKRKRGEPVEEETQPEEPKRGRTRKREVSAEPKRSTTKKAEKAHPENSAVTEEPKLMQGGQAKTAEQPAHPIIDVAVIAAAVSEAMKAGMEANHGELMGRLNRLEERVAAMANTQAALLAQFPRPASPKETKENAAPEEQVPPAAAKRPASAQKQCSFGAGSTLERYLAPKATDGVYITDMKGITSPGEPNTSNKGRRSSGIKWSILFADDAGSGSRRKSSVGVARHRPHQRSKSLCIPRT